jgi:hypothetical protein
MVNLEWKDIFGKIHTHDETLKKLIIDGMVNIIMSENGVSEKSFEKIDQIYDRVKSNLNQEIFDLANQLLQSGKRKNYVIEFIYDRYNKLFNSKNINESIKKFNDFR